MRYQPAYEMDKYLWCCAAPADPVTDYRPPPELFNRLTGGVYSPASDWFLATREYDTEAAAFADLQQAAQALYFSQHQPAQYQNPF